MKTHVIGYRSSIELLDLNPRLAPADARASSRTLPSGGLMASGDLAVPCERSRAARVPLVVAKSLPRPIDFLVGSSDGMRPNARVISHGCRAGVSLRDLVSIGDGWYACRPELAFAQMCCGLSLVRRIELGLQLCGTYRGVRAAAAVPYARRPGVSIDVFPRGVPLDACERATAYKVPPLTSVHALERFVAESPGLRGIDRVRRVLPYLRDGMASPLEAHFFLLACLPRRCGGAGLPSRPLVNADMRLGDQARRLLGKRVIHPDLWWPGAGVVVELLGKRDHASDAGIDETSLREKAYLCEGITCHTVTAREVADPAAFDVIMQLLARELGVRYRRPTPEVAARAARMRRDLGIGGRGADEGGARAAAAGSRFDGSLRDDGWFAALEDDIDNYRRAR